MARNGSACSQRAAVSFLLLSTLLLPLYQQVQASAPSSHRELRADQSTQEAHAQAAVQYLQKMSSGMECSSQHPSKRSCIFHNLCLLFGDHSGSSDNPDSGVVTAVRLAGSAAMAPANADDILKQMLGELLNSYAAVRVFTPSETQPAGTAADTNNTVAATAMRLWKGAVGTIGSRQQDGDALVLHPMWMRDSGDAPSSTSSSPSPKIYMQEGLVALLGLSYGEYSFGHGLGNNVLPAYLMLRNHLRPEDISTNMLLLFNTKTWSHLLLPRMLQTTLTRHVHTVRDWLDKVKGAGGSGVCFRNLVLGDGGYMAASLESLNGKSHAQLFTERPTFFTSSNWEDLKRHAFRVNGIMPEALKMVKPLIILNDKRYHVHGQVMEDRRMILDIDALADTIQAAYPIADVMVVAFRDYTLVDQLRIMAGAKVYITTAGSSSHMLVFMPRGSTAIILGGPEAEEVKAAPWRYYTAFNEVDRWLSLSYVNIERYETAIHDTEWYAVKRNPEVVARSWQPQNPQENTLWWQYNADIRVNMQRLRPMLDRALGKQ